MKATVKKSFAEIKEFITAIRQIEVISPTGAVITENGDKITYAIKAHVWPGIVRAEGQYLEDLEDLRIEHCMTGEKGEIIYDAKGNYVFSKEGLRAFNKEAKQLLEKPENYEIKCYIATECPRTESLPAEIKDVLSGIVFATIESKD